MTKLITIDYEEYLKLNLSVRERTIESCKNLINVLDDYRRNYSPKDDIYRLINTLENYLKTEISINQEGGRK